MLKEVIHISKLEDDKGKGKLNLDFLKRKKDKKSSPRADYQNETPIDRG